MIPLHWILDAVFIKRDNDYEIIIPTNQLQLRSPPLTSTNNEPSYSVSSILRNIMAYVIETELGGLFWNGQETIISRIILEELGYPQPPIPIKTHNYMTADIIDKTLRER